MRVCNPDHIACELNHCNLHTETNAEVRNTVLPRILRGKNHTGNSARTETARNNDSVKSPENFGAGRVVGQRFGIDPVNLNVRVEQIARVPQRFRNREVRVVQLHVFSDQPDVHRLFTRFDPRNHLGPFLQIGFGRVNVQLPADDFGEMRSLQHQRRFVEARQRDVLNHAVRLDVAEQRNFLENGFLQRLVATQNNDVRVNAHAAQFLDRMLSRLGLVLVRTVQKRHQSNMDKQAVLSSDFERDLTNRFQKRLRFDIADRSADLGNDHVRISLLSHAVNKILDLVRDVRNDLHR